MPTYLHTDHALSLWRKQNSLSVSLITPTDTVEGSHTKICPCAYTCTAADSNISVHLASDRGFEQRSPEDSNSKSRITCCIPNFMRPS